MDKKYNSTTNQKYSNNYQIFNLKSTSQKISLINYQKDKNSKIINDKESKSFGNFFNNNLINLSQLDKSSNNKQNLVKDEFSIDNISNIIEPQKNKFPNNHIIYEDNKSSLIDNNFQKKSISIPRLSNDTNSFSDNKMKVCDSHTKSFQLKMKKMKEMNKIIFKENFIKGDNLMNDSNKSENTYKNSNKSNYIINCKQKIISMRNKNKLIENMNDFNSFNIKLNENINLNPNNEIKVNRINPFLCCYGKS